MKAQHIRVTAQLAKKIPGVAVTSIRALLVALLVVTSTPVLARDAFWLPSPKTGDWNTASNWSTGEIAFAPVLPGDTATFNNSTITSLTLSGSIEIESITFNKGASAFTIDTNGFDLAVRGAGIVNNSGISQTITNNSNGSTTFLVSSSAGSATIISNPGKGTFGGVTSFFDSSDGGTARAIANGNGVFDISLLTTSGMGIGSIEGSGIFFLGGKTLTVGRNNLSTTVSGVIQDMGLDSSDTGGTLTKVGTGTLTLTGANTYSGGTNFNGGIIAVISDANLGKGALSFDGGTLEALAAGDGIISNKTITLNAGGGTFLADTGTFSILSGIIMDPIEGPSGSFTKVGTGELTLSGMNTYSGGTNINGGILAVSSDGNLGTGPLSFNGGTLEALAGLTSDKAITLNPGGGTFLADSGTTSTLNGVISGAGSWTKNGLGILILTAANTYSGGTTISAGTLQLGNGGTTGSITGDVTDNGILAFDRRDVFTFDGIISGMGSLQQNGTGTTVLTRNNTYTGGTTINGGTLQLGNGGTTGSITGDVTDNGVFAVNRSDTYTFAGTISGKGSFEQRGTGTTILTGTNTYIGGTSIVAGTTAGVPAGTLQLGDGGTTGSIVGDVTDDGVLAIDRSDTYTFAGIISGSGSFEQRGTGATIFTGHNTYTGTTTVNTGSLIIDGSIASAQTLVNPGGLLGGKGSIGGNLVNSGIVNPGPSPGLRVSGNYIQNANGTLRIEVAGTGQGQFSLLAVGKHASLGGTLQLIPGGGFQLHVGDKVTFLTANGGVSGNFSTIQNEFATVVKTQIIILPTAVELEGTQGSFVPAACNSNTAAVARSLDSAVGDPRATGLISFLDTEPFNKLCSDFTLIAPEQLTSVYNIAVSLANVQTANLERRMDDIRAGSTGFSGAGFTINGTSPSFSGGLSGPTGAEGKAGPSVLAPIPENRWGVFATGLGEFTHVDSTDTARGFDLQTGGFTLGVDYRIGSNFAIGLIAGYAHTNADLANNGDLDVNSGKFGLYATAFSGGFYLDTAVTGGISGYDSHRAALGGTASGSTNGGDLNVLVNGGYDWTKGGLSIGPTASFQYTYVSFDGFTETGSLAPLKFNDQHVDSIRTAFGAKASYDWKVGHIIIRPELRAAWQHEYGNSAYSIAASFANGAGSSFTVTSPKIGRDSLLLGAGVAVLLTDRISTYIYYDGELGRTNYQSNNVSAGVRITF